MAEDDKTITKAVKDYVDIEDDFRAEKLKANGEINKRRTEALNKILARVAKLDIMKEGFLAHVDEARGLRRVRSVFDKKVEAADDLDLAASYARTALASGELFEPIYDTGMKEHLERIVEEAEPSNVTALTEAAE